MLQDTFSLSLSLSHTHIHRYKHTHILTHTHSSYGCEDSLYVGLDLCLLGIYLKSKNMSVVTVLN